jgi:hypothetical protein
MIAPRDVAGSVGDQDRHSWRCCCVRNEGRVCEYVVYTDSDDVCDGQVGGKGRQPKSVDASIDASAFGQGG